MSLKTLLCIFCLFSVLSGTALSAEQTTVSLGRWSETTLEQMIGEAREIDGPGERIVFLSRHFVESPYAANTLIGDPQTPEQLVVNLAEFDCFTFLDVLEALRRAEDFNDFAVQLKRVRYRDGVVAYESRRHFFSDWVADRDAVLADVTARVGPGGHLVVEKVLNQKSDKTLWLPGIPAVRREISYLPTANIDQQVLAALQPGDYVGIYAHADGLDVSHTGLIVKEKGSVKLRHASSRDGVRRVVDEDLLTYLQGKPGLVVYRAH